MQLGQVWSQQRRVDTIQGVHLVCCKCVAGGDLLREGCVYLMLILLEVEFVRKLVLKRETRR